LAIGKGGGKKGNRLGRVPVNTTRWQKVGEAGVLRALREAVRSQEKKRTENQKGFRTGSLAVKKIPQDRRWKNWAMREAKCVPSIMRMIAIKKDVEDKTLSVCRARSEK